MSTARIKPGREADFRALIVAMVADFPERYPGLESHDVLVSLDGSVLVYVSRWVDEDALVRFAGAGWRDTPVTFPNESDYLTMPLELQHYSVIA
jgi:hypothetical protein